MRVSFQLILAAFCVGGGLFAASVVAEDSAAKRSTLKLAADLYSLNASSETAHSRLAGTQVTSDLRYRISQKLSARLWAGLWLETGASQALYTSDFEPRQGPQLIEASLCWAPVDDIALLAGALDQNQWEMPLLLRDQSFPALLETYRVDRGKFHVSASAEQAYAADTAAPLLAGKRIAGPSNYYMERLAVAYREPEVALVEWHLSHFLFESLSPAIAAQSRFSGNSIVGIANQSAFAYEFRGFETGVSARQRLVRGFDITSRASAVWNTSAPSGKNFGCDVGVGVAAEISRAILVSPRLEWFRIDSDASPAFYNDRAIGHANSRGFGAAVDADFKESGIQASLRWTGVQPVAPSAYQSGLNWLELRLRTSHDIL